MATYEGDLSNVIGDIKRCYIDGVIITKKCPNCGKDVEKDLGDDYISYPAADEVLHFYCWDGCDHEWEVPVKLTAKMIIEEV